MTLEVSCPKTVKLNEDLDLGVKLKSDEQHCPMFDAGRACLRFVATGPSRTELSGPLAARNIVAPPWWGGGLVPGNAKAMALTFTRRKLLFLGALRRSGEPRGYRAPFFAEPGAYTLRISYENTNSALGQLTAWTGKCEAEIKLKIEDFPEPWGEEVQGLFSRAHCLRAHSYGLVLYHELRNGGKQPMLVTQDVFLTSVKSGYLSGFRLRVGERTTTVPAPISSASWRKPPSPIVYLLAPGARIGHELRLNGLPAMEFKLQVTHKPGGWGLPSDRVPEGTTVWSGSLVSNEIDIDVLDVLSRKNKILLAPPADYTGTWTIWYDDEQRRSEINCKEGQVHGLATYWYKNGQKQSEVSYKEGQVHGPSTYWYRNGQKQSERRYERQMSVGRYTYWHPNGHKKEEGFYKLRRGYGAVWTAK